MADEAEIARLANIVSKETNCEVVIYNGPVDEGGLGSVLRLIPELLTTRKGCMLILVTYGGLAGPAYRIARLLQDLFEPFTVFITGPCKSAGTLLVTGAHKLYFFPHSGELGPLDVQLYKRDEIGERRSGLVTKSAIESLGQHAYELFSYFMMETKTRGRGVIRFRTATELATLITTGLVSQIYQKIDPDTVGEEHRDTQVAYQYATRLLKKGKNLLEGGVHQLVYDYPSHDFVIDFIEAKEVFRDVSQPTRAMADLVSALGAEAIVPGNVISVRRLSTSATADVGAGESDEQATGATQGNGKSRGQDEPSGNVGDSGSNSRQSNRRTSKSRRHLDSAETPEGSV